MLHAHAWIWILSSTRYLMSEIPSWTWEDKIHIHKQACNVLFISEKSAIYYVTIMMVISSLVKITCYFHVWRYYEVFTKSLTSRSNSELQYCAKVMKTIINQIHELLDFLSQINEILFPSKLQRIFIKTLKGYCVCWWQISWKFCLAW